MKVVINKKYGGFSLSDKAYDRLREFIPNLRVRDPDSSGFNYPNVERNNPFLVQVVKELGAAADGVCADLRIVEIPDDVKWEIEEYDGLEHIAEQHRVWD